jgi:pimeloyl-ACP methyl ester carboxylesterase
MSVLHYVRRGSGTPVVLLHGIGHHWQAWAPVLDRLAQRHTVYAVDLPGFGSSPLPPEGIPDGMRSAVALVAQVCAEWGLDRPHVAGNSLGGALALELAAAGLAGSATVFSPAGFATPTEAGLALASLRALRLTTRLPAGVLRTVLGTRAGRALSYWPLLGHPSRMPAEQALLDALALRGATGFAATAAHARTYAFTGVITVPVTVAWGTRDRILLSRQAQRARLRLPAARHVALPGAGHVPMFDEPELVAELIMDTAAEAESLAAGAVPDSDRAPGVQAHRGWVPGPDGSGPPQRM